MGSTRLPGKILKPIAGKPLLLRIAERLARRWTSSRFIIATSDTPPDDAVAAFCREQGIECFRGSEADVLDRYYRCAKQNGFRHIVRLTGDNPFVDVEEIDRLIALHLEARVDYAHSFDGLPVGVGAEIFTFEALERSFIEGQAPNHREHVNEYIQENPGLFHIACLKIRDSKRHPEVRLTVDTPADFKKACFICEQMAGERIRTEDAIRLSHQFESLN